MLSKVEFNKMKLLWRSVEWNDADDYRKAVVALKRVLAAAKDPNADELMTPFRYEMIQLDDDANVFCDVQLCIRM